MARSERGEPLLQVRLFGGPVLIRDEDAIPLSAYQSALLSAVFGAGSRGMTRLELTRLLWTDGDEQTRRRRLSQLLYSLARKAPPGPIAAEKERIRPDLETTSSDLDEYERALREGDLSRAMSLGERPFLEVLADEVTDAFGDWVRAKRLGLRRDLRARASGLWSEAHREARWSQALAAAEVLLRIDPLDEEALRRVITVHAMLGQLAEAGAARQAFEEQHRLEAGEWVPDGETRELLDRIETIALEEGDGSEDPGASSEPPLCGREKELAALTRQVLIEEGDGLRLVTVRGEGGMGKTRLVEEALKATRFGGIRVLRAGSSEFERDIPLNPILEALSRPDVGEVIRGLEDPWRQVLLSLMPELHEGPGPLPEIPQVRPGSLPRRLFEAIRQVFLAIVQQGPTVLFLDDFHWADDTSIAALEYLRRRWEGGGLCIVLAIRPEDLVREGAAARFVQALEPLDEAVEIEVGDLSEEGVGRLIWAIAGRRLSASKMERVASLSGNSPFFVIELTMEALEGRELTGDDVPELTPVPLSIRQLLSHRLAGLSEQSEHLLGLLAAFGQSLPDNELRRLGELSGEGFVTSIEALQALRLVERSEGEIRIRHELIRQTIYSRLSDARRSFIHERIAQFLIQFWNPTPADKLALHFDRAGARSEACTYAIQAADVSQAAGAISEALRFLALARQNTDDPSAATEILWRLAHLHYLHRNLSEAGPLLELAANRLRIQGRSKDALEAEAEKLDTLASLGAIPEEDVLSEIYRLKETAKREDDWSIVATLLDTAIHIHNRSNSFESVRQCLEELELYLDKGDNEAKVHLRSSLFAHVFFGEPSKGVAFSSEAVNIAEDLGQKHLWLKAVNRYLVTTLTQGLFNAENSISLIRKAQEAAKVSGDLLIKCRLHSNLGVWRLDEGNYTSALAELHRALDVLRDTEAPHLKVNLYYNMGEAYYLTSNIDESYNYFSMAQDVINTATPKYYAPLIQVGLGLCELFRGHFATASKIDQSIHLDEEHWSYDPSLYVLFKKKLLLRRGKHREVIDTLEYFISALGERFPTQVLHLKLDLADLLHSLPGNSDRRAVGLLEEVIEIASGKELRILAGEARWRLKRIGSAAH